MKAQSVVLLTLAMIALFGTFVYINQYSENGNLANSSNTTTFFEKNQCIDKLDYFECDLNIKEDDTELSLCYQSAYGVSRLTYPDGDLLTDACRNYLAYLAKSVASDPINGNNYYYECFLSADVLKQAFQSQVFYNQNYVPRMITCAGY